MRKTLLSLALAAILAGTAQASDSNGSQSTAEGINTNGELHAIEGNRVNVTHDPIPEIGWPKMTMDLILLEGARIDGVEPGDKVIITLQKGPDGLYGVRALEAIE